MTEKGQLTETTPDELLQHFYYSPADNIEHYQTAVPWKSSLVGSQIRSIYKMKSIVSDISSKPFVFGPLAMAAYFQQQFLEAVITGPVSTAARISAANNEHPDIFAKTDEATEKAYAGLFKNLCGLFIENGKFNDKKAREVSGNPSGHALLQSKLAEFYYLECQYNALGLTRLRALKELLITLLIAITGNFPKKGTPPFMSQNEDGSFKLSKEAYIEQAKERLVSIYMENAFDIRSFAERMTGGKIGCTPYTIVPGSQIKCVTLRQYARPRGVKDNGKILYLASPLINMPEIYDLDHEKSVIEKMAKQGYTIFLVDPGDPGVEECELPLNFYSKIVHDKYIDMITQAHPKKEIFVMGYCMGGTLILPYLARRAEERLARGEKMDITKVALMATPLKFDDGDSGHGPMREIIRKHYDADFLADLFRGVNIPPQIIEAGMNDIQPGVKYSVSSGFYSRAMVKDALRDSASFLYWLTHSTKFSLQAHREWIYNIFIDNQIYNNQFCLSSTLPRFDGKPVNMNILEEAGVKIFDYRGKRDPIAPAGSCVASETWGLKDTHNRSHTRGGLNRTIEKNIGHIFVVSKKLLGEFIENVSDFFDNA